MPGDLKTLLRKAKNEYETRKSAAESAVVRWEHWSGPGYDPKPLYFERALRAGQVKRGKPVAKAAKNMCSYGFDAKGRVVIDRQPRDRDGTPAFDEFFVYDKNGIESAAYAQDKPHKLQYVTRQVHRAGVPISTDVLDADAAASHSEKYTYTKGRLTGIDVIAAVGKDSKKIKFDVVYERDGRLRTIRRYYDYLRMPFPIYWNPESGETLESLTNAMRKWLLDLIPKTLAKAKIKSPAYCLALVYDTENDDLPPLLAVGLDSERQAWIASKGKAAKDLIWSPGDFDRYETGKIELDAPNLLEASQKLLQMILSKEALWIPRRLLNEIATEFNKRGLKGILPTTDDFIVFAVDVDGDDLAKNLKEGVPESKRKLLRSRKLL